MCVGGPLVTDLGAKKSNTKCKLNLSLLNSSGEEGRDIQQWVTLKTSIPEESPPTLAVMEKPQACTAAAWGSGSHGTVFPMLWREVIFEPSFL
jgi:hypothetical protein